MTLKRIAVAAFAAWFLLGGIALAEQAAWQQTARRGADDAVEGHKSDHHSDGAASTNAADPPKGKGKALFEEKCVICHDLNRALSQKKNKKGWTTTVTRMQKTNGCPITDKEAAEIVQYLTTVRGAK